MTASDMYVHAQPVASFAQPGVNAQSAYGHAGFSVPVSQMSHVSQPQMNPSVPGGVLRVQGGVVGHSQQGSYAAAPKAHAAPGQAMQGQPHPGQALQGQPPPGQALQGVASTALSTSARPVSSTALVSSGHSPAASQREMMLEQRVRDLENLVNKKDETIKELQAALGAAGVQSSFASAKKSAGGQKGSGFRKVADSKPAVRYQAVDQDDPIDVRLEEFYNSTGSAVQFRRINRGFYRFGDSIVELSIINHKLMARTEDGWNRGKFGAVEKFLVHFEDIEREKMGIIPDA